MKKLMESFLSNFCTRKSYINNISNQNVKILPTRYSVNLEAALNANTNLSHKLLKFKPFFRRKKIEKAYLQQFLLANHGIRKT